MKSAISVIREQLSSLYLIQRLAIYEIKTENSGNYLGLLWEIINPMIQIAIYYFVFGYGMHRTSNHTPPHLVNGIPYFAWLLAGISLWFFANQSILLGSKSIYTRIGFISKMSFPMSAIPSFIIMAKFYQHIILVCLVAIILYFNGFTPSVYYLQLPYYFIATLIFLLSVSLITSTLSTIVRDVHMIVASIMRVMIYLTPFLWTPDRLPHIIQGVMKLNPLYYLVEGYRATLLGESWYFVSHAKYTLYFWVAIIVLFSFGSMLHLKFRNHFVDYL